MKDVLHELSMLSLSLQQNNISISNSHTLVKKTLATLVSMKTTLGRSVLLVNEALEEGFFGKTKLSSNTAVEVIPRNMFLQALHDQVRQRMLTTISRKGQEARHAANSANLYDLLIDVSQLLDPLKWDSQIDTPLYGERKVEALCEFFALDVHLTLSAFRSFKVSGGIRGESSSDLNTLHQILDTIPVSTADCERSISAMNLIVTKLRSVFDTPNVGSLMFISIVGPSAEKFNPSDYVESWLKAGNHKATDSNSLGRTKNEQECSPYSHLWKIFQ